MAKQLYTNNAETVLNGSLSSASTTITLSAGSGSAFPSVTSSDYFVGTIYELNGSGLEINHEIVKVTARVADSLTVVRAFDNTTARKYPDNTTNNPSQVVYFSLRWTAYAAGNALSSDDNLASISSASTARTNLGLGSISTQNAGSVAITGGSITGITDLAVADGGTGASTASGARTNLGAAISGANNDITSLTAIIGGVGTPDYIDFDTAATTTGAVGRLRWDDTNGTAQLGLKGGNVNLQIGQEIVALVRNAETTTLLDGEVVYLSGVSGNKATVKRASNASELLSSKTFGMVTEPILAGQTGFVTRQGVVNGLNTSAFNAGDFVWLGATAGSLANTRPNPPAHAVLVGIVEKASVGGGSIYVNISNGWELDELHNVYITGAGDDDSLFYDSATGLWTNRTPANARIALGGTTVGLNLFTLVNPSAITFPRFNADNTVSTLTASDFRTAIGAGTGSGTVTSVAALTLGTTGTDLSSTVATGTTTPVITLNVPTASSTNRGALSSTDWSTFNSKAGLADDQTWTGSQRGTVTTDNDGSFDMNASNNFKCTPTGTFTLTFTNITAGQSGYVYLVNTGGYAITKASSVLGGATLLTTISTAGKYLLSYFTDGTDVIITSSQAVS